MAAGLDYPPPEGESYEVTVLVPFDELQSRRSSVKFTRYERDILPLSVAEMDYEVAEPIAEAIIDRIRASDFGYIDAPGPLGPAFARFAADRWGWHVDPALLRVTTDVSVGLVETLRYGVPAGSQVVVTPPVYTPFYEVIEEARGEAVGVPLVPSGDGWAIDLEGVERAFAGGAKAFLLCNPQNPTGTVHSAQVLEGLAELAARYGVLVISDEVHAPLAHPGVVFTPFAPLAARAGARAICLTSASKGWNLAGLKCAMLIAADAASLEILERFPEEVTCRTSILGLHANVAAFQCADWLDDTISRIVANNIHLAALIAEQLPGVRYYSPEASYLGWIDFTGVDLGDDPAVLLIDQARVALNSGLQYGESGTGFARINLACDPAILTEAVRRIAAYLARGR